MPKLTALQVKNAKPGRHSDGEGLFLVVRPAPGDSNKPGSRSWVLRVQVEGPAPKRRDYGLGSTLSLTEARERAAAWRKIAKAGGHAALAEAKRGKVEIPTFDQAARKYHENIKSGWKNRKHGDQWLSTLETYAFPIIGRARVDVIGVSELQSVLLPIWLTVPETARRVRQRIAAVLDFSHAHGWRASEAPMKAVMKGLPKQPRGGHFEAMPYSDLPAFMAKLREGDGTLGRLALQFAILTATRSGETRGAKWSEVDLEQALWTIPAKRMKGGVEHVVPLSAPALAILKDLHDLIGNRPADLIFPGHKGKALSDMTLGKALKVAGGGSATVHGMRSTFRDWVAEQCPSVPGDVAEAALAHQIKDKTEAAYRRAKYLDQRGPLMQAWADHCLGDRRNVVQMVA